jgi:hypothetical protein
VRSNVRRIVALLAWVRSYAPLVGPERTKLNKFLLLLPKKLGSLRVCRQKKIVPKVSTALRHSLKVKKTVGAL